MALFFYAFLDIDDKYLSSPIWDYGITAPYIGRVFDLSSFTYSDALAAVLKFSGRQIVIF